MPFIVHSPTISQPLPLSAYHFTASSSSIHFTTSSSTYLYKTPSTSSYHFNLYPMSHLAFYHLNSPIHAFTSPIYHFPLPLLPLTISRFHFSHLPLPASTSSSDFPPVLSPFTPSTASHRSSPLPPRLFKGFRLAAKSFAC